jgi:hypothetical protein
MIFISFCFIAIANSIKIAMKLKEIFIDNDIRNANPFAYYRFVLIICFCLFLLNLLWKNTFFDEKVIKSIFFLPSLHSSLMWVIIVGYVAGAFCLGGFIYTAGALGFVDDNIQALRNETNLKVNNFRKNVGLDKEGKPDEISDINKVTEEHTRQIVVQGNLVKSFNTYFLLSSVILSLMVLCTGGLNSLVNSLDFVKLLNDDWGYSPARTDFVLLYGGIHTVLLLLVYLPARMRFNEIPLQEIDIPDEAQSKGWHEIIKNPFASFKDLLVVGSPFLASIVQALFDLLFNK